VGGLIHKFGILPAQALRSLSESPLQLEGDLVVQERFGSIPKHPERHATRLLAALRVLNINHNFSVLAAASPGRHTNDVEARRQLAGRLGGDSCHVSDVESLHGEHHTQLPCLNVVLVGRASALS